MFERAGGGIYFVLFYIVMLLCHVLCLSYSVHISAAHGKQFFVCLVNSLILKLKMKLGTSEGLSVLFGVTPEVPALVLKCTSCCDPGGFSQQPAVRSETEKRADVQVKGRYHVCNVVSAAGRKVSHIYSLTCRRTRESVAPAANSELAANARFVFTDFLKQLR